MCRVFCALLVIALVAPLVAGEEDLTEARAALEGVLDPLIHHYRAEEGPSITARFSRLIACGDERVRAVLREVWKAAEFRRSDAWRASWELEQVARFLYGHGDYLERLSGGLRFVDGALVQWIPDSSSGSRGRFEPDLPTIEEHTEGRDLRAPLEPDGPALLERVRAGRPKAWSRTEWTDLCRALGEVAGGDEEVLSGLLALWRTSPNSRHLLTALARTGSPRAGKELEARFLHLVKNLVERGEEVPLYEWERHPLRLTGRALLAVAPGAAHRVLSGLSGAHRAAALRGLGLRCSVPILLDAIEAAESREARFKTARELHAVVFGRGGGEFPRASDAPRVIRTLTALIEEAAGDDLACVSEIAGLLFFDDRPPDPPAPRRGAYGRLYPDALTLFGQLAADVEAGRFVFLDEEPGVLAPPVMLLGDSGARAHSDVPCPFSDFTSPRKAFPVHLTAQWVDDGLRLTISNRGKTAFLINPVTLSYGWAHRTKEKVFRAGIVHVVSQLNLILGYQSAAGGVPRNALRTLEPGEGYTWTHPVHPRNRDVDHIAVQISGYTEVLGGTELPYLKWLNTSWVR